MKKRWIIFISVIVLLIIIRLILPVILENMANKKLEGIKGFEGVVEDVDLKLYKGMYIIDSVYFLNKDTLFPEPLMIAKEVKVQIDWEALFDSGEVVAKITVVKPEVNIETRWDGEEGVKKRQTGQGVKWFDHFKKMSPLRFNQLNVEDGNVFYTDFTTSPNVDFRMTNISISASNLQNTKKLDTILPGDIHMSALLLNGGELEMNGALNFLKDPPDMNMNLTIEGMQLANANDAMRVYTNLDFDTGIFNLYSEMKMNDGQIDGYMKPVMDNVSIISKNENEDFLNTAWEYIAGGIVEVFENQQADQLATRVPVSGSIKNVNSDRSAALWNILENAFVDAFRKSLEGSVEFQETKSDK